MLEGVAIAPVKALLSHDPADAHFEPAVKSERRQNDQER